MGNWTLVMSGGMWQELRDHLFPGDGGEHGAVIGAGIAHTDRGCAFWRGRCTAPSTAWTTYPVNGAIACLRRPSCATASSGAPAMGWRTWPSTATVGATR